MSDALPESMQTTTPAADRPIVWMIKDTRTGKSLLQTYSREEDADRDCRTVNRWNDQEGPDRYQVEPVA